MKWNGVLLACLLGLGGLTGHVLASDNAIPVIQAMDLQQKIDTLELGKSTLNDILARFGEPQGYYDADMNLYKREEIRDGGQIPGWYVMPYHGDKLMFSLLAAKLAQVQVMEPGYSYNGVSVGSSIDEVYSVFGRPEEVLDVNPNTTAVLVRKTVLCQWVSDGIRIKLYTTSTRTLGFYMTDDKVVTIVRLTN